ncbi:MAG: DMT family transporter [Bacillota bacterium]|nr:DMT family transporter [Bacillota bacterium]
MLFFFAVLGAPNYVVVKIAMAEIPPFVIAAIRFAISGLILLLLAYATEQTIALPPGTGKRILLLGAVGIFGYQVFFSYGLARTTSGNAALMVAMSPLFATLYALLTRAERLTAKVVGGIATGFLGAFLVIAGRGGRLGIQLSTIIGDLLMLCASMIWAFYGLLSNTLLERVSPYKMTAYAMLTGSALLAIAAGRGFHETGWSAVTLPAWLSLAYATLISCCLVYVLWSVGIHRIGVARGMVYMYLQPFVALLVGVWLLQERVNWFQLLGAAVIIASIATVRGSDQASREASRQASRKV